MTVSAAFRARVRWHDPSVNSELIDSFELFERSQGFSPATIKNRRCILLPLARFLDGPLLDATTADLRRYLARGGVQASTVRVERAAMQAFYAFVVDEGHLERSPAERLAPVRVPRSLPRPFTREQIVSMLDSGAYLRTRAMILLGYAQGFRVSQIARVRGDDLDRVGQTISTVSKGGKRASLPLSPMIEAIADLMPASGFWFPSPYREGPIRSTSVTDAITAAIERAGITDPRLTPHSLRHSFGSELVEAGVDIRVVQELMLHEDLSTTQVYTRVSEHRKRDGMDALPAIELPRQSSRCKAA